MLRKNLSGWRSGLAWCTGATALVAITNITILCVGNQIAKPYSTALQEGQSSSGISRDGAIFAGSCATAKKLSTWLHVAINILSTTLLTCGNFAQQMLTGPTREEIDSSHIKGKDMEIGLFSFSNLSKISRKRLTAWVILALASLPIHLLYNSVVFLETSVNAFDIFIIQEANITDSTTKTPLNDPDGVDQTEMEGFMSLKGLERLENDACIKKYSKLLISDRSDLVIVTNSDGPAVYEEDAHYISVTPGYSETRSSSWICPDSPYLDGCEEFSHPGNWTLYDDRAHTERHVEYCLSRQTKEDCRLTLSIPLLAIVIACNLLKLTGLAVTWVWLDKTPILTLGDAIASFLSRPLLIGTEYDTSESSRNQHPTSRLHMTLWQSRLTRSWGSITRARYALTLIGFFSLLSCAAYYLNRGRNTSNNPSFSQMWRAGLGTLDVNYLAHYNDGYHDPPTVVVIILSNLPQLFVTILYTNVNGMWTAMRVGKEWNSYGLYRKSLRTSSPVGQQRTTHWLSLPWRYALPLVIASTMLHWLISQSLFPVRLIVNYNKNVINILTTSGYSCISIILSMLCGSIIILVTVVMSLISFQAATPQPATTSTVLSAACQRPQEDVNAAMGLVKWGVVCAHREQRLIEHCSVTSWDVEEPQIGKLYTGIDLGNADCSCCSNP